MDSNHSQQLYLVQVCSTNAVLARHREAYKDIINFTAYFKSLYNKITLISTYLKLEINFLIFLFYIRLKLAYSFKYIIKYFI